MSVATFHTVPASKAEALLDAATTKSRVVERRLLMFTWREEQPVEDFEPFIHHQMTEQEAFEYSGLGFVYLEILLRREGIELFALGHRESSQMLSEAQDSTIVLFDHRAAREALAMLEPVELDAEEVTAFCTEEDAQGAVMLADDVHEALAILKRWLATVGEDELGMFELT